MLIHEIEEGHYGYVDQALYVQPEGCATMRVPGYVHHFTEKDGTLTLDQPLICTDRNGTLVHAFLIHDRWTVLPVAIGSRAA